MRLGLSCLFNTWTHTAGVAKWGLGGGEDCTLHRRRKEGRLDQRGIQPHQRLLGTGRWSRHNVSIVQQAKEKGRGGGGISHTESLESASIGLRVRREASIRACASMDTGSSKWSNMLSSPWGPNPSMECWNARELGRKGETEMLPAANPEALHPQFLIINDEIHWTVEFEFVSLKMQLQREVLFSPTLQILQLWCKDNLENSQSCPGQVLIKMKWGSIPTLPISRIQTIDDFKIEWSFTVVNSH